MTFRRLASKSESSGDKGWAANDGRAIVAGTSCRLLRLPPYDANSTEKGGRMDQSFPGWRARIGVIYPASGLADMEYYRLCPSGVSVHVTRSSVPNDGGVTLADVLEVAEGRQFTQLAEDLATVRPHALAWMCTSGSFSRGAAWDAELCRTLMAHGECPATTTSTALVTALHALGVRRVALATPYEVRSWSGSSAYLAEHGITVVSCVGLGLIRDWEISALTPLDLAALVRKADSPEAEAVFLSDTCLVLSPSGRGAGSGSREAGLQREHGHYVARAAPGRCARLAARIRVTYGLHPAREPPA